MPVSTNKTPAIKNAILFGNGLMRTLGSPSSPDLLKQTICSRPCGECAGSYCPFTEEKDCLPFPLIYEYLILKEQKQYQEKNMRAISAMMREKLKKQLERFTPQNHPESVLHALADLRADDYLTTNYDTFLHRILELRDYEQAASQNSETKYSIRRHILMRKQETSHSCRLWNIHGTYNDRPDSFTIQYGYEHYCGCIGKIDNYLKGTYTYQLRKKEISIPPMYKKLQDDKLRKGESWIDLFFFSNVHILGLNLSPEEIDLLYILNLRSRWLRDPKIKNRIRNRIVFYGQPTNAVKALLKQFSVEVRSSSPKPPGKNAEKQAYENYYKRVLKVIKSGMQQSEN